MIINIIRRRIILRTTPRIRLTRPLIHPYIINLVLCRKNHCWQIYRLPIRCCYLFFFCKYIRIRRDHANKKKRNIRDIPKFKTIDIGSSGINLCPTPLPPVPWSGPTAGAYRLVVCCPFTCQFINPLWRLFGSDQYSNPVFIEIDWNYLIEGKT